MSGDTELIMTAFQKLVVFWRASQWQTAGEAGLNPTQGEVLQHISRRSARLGELAEQLGVSQASLSDTVSSLEARGLARRRPDPDDGRARRIESTADGQRAVAELSMAPVELERAIEHLGEEERGAFARALVRIIRMLQEADAIPVQRMCVTCRHFRPFAHADVARPHHCAFVDAAFGDARLRLDCDDHEAAPAKEAAATWRRFEMA
ncbi:MAG: MarR family winged helix-turn-helix transcriptional regulator [Marivita sp.]|uniref:MarR family winged helix-turn-helix transcriptional regulator n=1 Tax=Marivita sp. TaxID=2003365 RepID=UPI0025C08426|nr:MarR family winged helix-turn-helix transcriptional regulator [Marivita sp.]MCI5109757.1 MarR family winged helix-turn-helix transcriptional regulator [Marivita sp.]